MCHVYNLNDEELGRLRRMDQAHRDKLEQALEDGLVASTRSAVVPIFENVYAKWCEVEAVRTAARKPEAVRYAGLPTATYDPQRPFTTGVLNIR